MLGCRMVWHKAVLLITPDGHLKAFEHTHKLTALQIVTNKMANVILGASILSVPHHETQTDDDGK